MFGAIDVIGRILPTGVSSIPLSLVSYQSTISAIMLPFSLKIIWFCLSLTGTISCWVVLTMFSRAIGVYWGPMLYSIFTTLMQGIFCLGLIYDMDPFQMPKAFCIVQTFVIYYTAWSLTGVCAAFTFATSSSVLHPSTKKCPATSILGWKKKYYFPIFVFPLACLSISVPVLLKTNAIRPTDDLHCDASHPEWGRFLGYAGFPMILTIPCLFFTTAAARRVYQLNRDIQPSRYSYRHTTLGHISNGQDIPSEGVKSPVILPNNTTPTSVDPETPYSSPPTDITEDVEDAIRYDPIPLSSPATCGVPSASYKPSETWEDLDPVEEDAFDRRTMRGMTMLSMSSVAPPPRPNLAPAVWRLILFQMAFFITQCLAALSTVIDVARHKPEPTPFGSQHVALVLVGWGPVIVFGHLPVVRRQLMFWKR